MEKNLNVALCCIAKLENKYIREFVEYYKSIGFTHIFICDNNNVDGERFEEVINDYIESGFVTILDYRGVRGYVQFDSYRDCFKNYKKDYDWMAFFDCDEFLILDEKYKNISEVLSLPIYNGYDAINVCWKNYGDNNIIEVVNNDYSVLNRFTKPCENCTEEDKEIKTIARCSTYRDFDHIHCGNIKFNACNSAGEHSTIISRYKNNIDVPSYENMILNHYRTKSLQEYIEIRMARGYYEVYHVYNDRFSMDYYFTFNEKTQEKIDFINKYNKN